VYPNLKFELLDVMWGLSSVVLYDVNQKGSRTGEVFRTDDEGQSSYDVERSTASRPTIWPATLRSPSRVPADDEA